MAHKASLSKDHFPAIEDCMASSSKVEAIGRLLYLSIYFTYPDYSLIWVGISEGVWIIEGRWQLGRNNRRQAEQMSIEGMLVPII